MTAREELRLAFPAARVVPVGAETGALVLPEGDTASVAMACRQQPVVFVRHLMSAIERLPVPESSRDAEVIVAAAATLSEAAGSERTCSLQVWSDPAVQGAWRPDELRQRVTAHLEIQGMAISRGGADLILGVCVTPDGTYPGLTEREEALTDWPGGRVGLAHRSDQISRSALKLEELFKIFPLALPVDGDALDLGASPGGWTRILRQAGLRVWAIDPADLDPHLESDPGVHHVRTTAGRFLRETRQTFDLVVNDLRMTADLSATLLVNAAARLRRDGLAIMTVKLGRDAPRETVRDVLRVLDQTYAILFARQLFHNRHEVTVVARRR